MVGLALGNNPPYEFHIKPNQIDTQSQIDKTVTIKIKIKSKKNPNYIKLVAMAEIKMS